MSGYRKYTPQLPDELIHALWARKEETGVPMARQLRDAVESYLKSEGRDVVQTPDPQLTTPR